MNTYKDSYGFIHDRPTNDGYISGNSCIYSAIYQAAGGDKIDYYFVYYGHMYKKLALGNDVSIVRHPDIDKPTSLDEIIGAWCLGLLSDEQLKHFDYKWHDTLHSPKWYRVLQSAIYCAGKHRNFFKENGGVRDLHPIAYQCPPHVKYMFNRKLRYMPFFYMWLISVLIKKNYKKGEKQTGAISQKNIAYAVLKKLGSKWWIRLIDYKENINSYFDKYPDHLIRELVNANNSKR